MPGKSERSAEMVKKGQEQVSRMDSPRQGEDRDPKEGKIKHKGGSQSQRRATPPSEGSSKG
jgi:hypothetical protein